MGESVESCARREVKEETGLHLGVVRQGPYTNDVMAAEGKHYVTCFVEASASAGEAQVLEPTKCERWAWFAWSSMPERLFQPLMTLAQSGYVPTNAKPSSPLRADQMSGRMKYEIRSIGSAHAAETSAVIHESFLALNAADWQMDAQSFFLRTTEPESLRSKLSTMIFAAGAFSGSEIAGVILMPSPSLLGLLFVRPQWLRLGIGQALWESARAHIETKFPEVNTVELNSTPYAVRFYKSVGFVPISSEFERDGQRAVRMACWLPARALGAGVRQGQ